MRTRRDLLAVALLCLAGVGVPLWLAAAAGAIGVPSNDDWVYMRAATTLHETGTIGVSGHSAALIGQLVLVQPLLWLSGGDAWAYTAFGVLMASIVVVSTYVLARGFLGSRPAVIVVLTVIAFPGFARSATSFMTDVPAFALMMLSLLLGTSWLRGRATPSTLIGSMLVGVLAVSIRELALAAPLAILAAAWAHHTATHRPWLMVATVTLALGTGVVVLAVGSMPAHAHLAAPNPNRVVLLLPAVTTVAAVLLPALVIGVGRRLATISPQVVLVAVALVVLAFAVPLGPLIGNYWSATGVVGNIPVLAGARDPVIGAGAWALSGQLAILAGVLLAVLIVRTSVRYARRATIGAGPISIANEIAASREAPLLLFVGAYAGELVVVVSTGAIFDRYLYPLVPVMAILILLGVDHGPVRGRSQAFAQAALVWLAASALLIAANSLAYDGARFRAGQAAVALGYDPRTVDAGLEWAGLHAETIIDPSGVTRSYGLAPYANWLMSEPPCAVVADSPLDHEGYRLMSVDPAAYLQYLAFGPPKTLYTYGSTSPACAHASAMRGARLHG